MGGLDDASNIAALTPEEHFLAHILLAKIHPSTKLIHAAHMMSITRSFASNKAYGWLRRQHANITRDQMLIRWQDDQYRNKILAGLQSANLDPANKAKRSEKLKAVWQDPILRQLMMGNRVGSSRTFTEEHKANISKARLGKEPANKGKRTGVPAWNAGSSASEETRQRMRESAKLRWEKHHAK
jgi:hypothetical protein